MSPLADRVRARLAFDERRYAQDDGAVYCGASEERERTARLDLALVECVRALDNAENVLRIIYHTTDGRTRQEAHECAAQITQALAAVARAVGEG